jgi:hypothetical protein
VRKKPKYHPRQRLCEKYEFHQRSWWIVHTQPSGRDRQTSPVIPPTQLVDRSYLASSTQPTNFSGKPTNAVGGSFILSLYRTGLTLHVSLIPKIVPVGGLFILGILIPNIPSFSLLQIEYERSTNCVGGIRTFRIVSESVGFGFFAEFRIQCIKSRKSYRNFPRILLSL